MADKVPLQERIPVEVAIALPDHQEILALSVEAGCTAQEVVALSGFPEKYRQYLPAGEEPALGIFSRPLNGVELPLPNEYVLEPHDRVEIYRPLENDPKQARLERAARTRQEKQGKKG